MKDSLQEGQILLIDKPYGWTSFDVVNKIKILLRYELGLPKIKIGHAGTLDPLATGLLIVCTGKFTKRIEEFQDQEKEYTGTFYLGKTTPSHDMEHEPDEDFPVDHLTEEVIIDTASRFLGFIEQVPPVFSAIKVEGRRAYKFARKKQDLRLEPRLIQIRAFDITAVRMPQVDFRVICSKGTYIRALARDYGKALRSGAYLQRLCRTRIGDFQLSEAVTIDALPQRFGIQP